MRAHLWWMVLGTAAVLASCSDDGPAVGAIRITLATTGGDPDLDGYVVVIDSAAPVHVAANDTTLVSNIPTGAHTAVLDSVAANCDVNGGASQEVFVRGGGTTGAAFTVACFATGVQVTVATSGVDLDPDGYAFSVDGAAPRGISLNGSATITRMTPGSHTVRLSGFAANCDLSGGTSPRAVDVTLRQVSVISFSIACRATSGAIAVTAATSGVELDLDGYSVRVDDGAPRLITVNGTVVFQALAQGDHTVTLEGAAGNCSIGGENPRTLNVTTGSVTRDTARTTFTVTCLATTGFLRVRAVTSGGDLDPNGYTLFLDEYCYEYYYYQYCDYVWVGPVAPNGAVTPPRLSVGEHTLTVSDVARNCDLAGENPRTATVAPGDTVEVVLTVTCALTGSVRATVTTTGVDLDPDGYYVSVQGGGETQQRSIGTNASVTIAQLLAGDYTVTLLGLAGNCTVSGANPVTTTVVSGATADVAFSVTCTPFGSLQVTTVTTGADLDPNGYTVQLIGPSASGFEIPTNGAVTRDQLLPGDYVVTLLGAAANCTVVPPNPRTVTVAGGATASVTFDVGCVQLARLQVTVATSGMDLDPDGYSVFAGGPSSMSGTVAANGTVTLGPLVPGDYSVRLDAVAVNCDVTAPNPRIVTVSGPTTAAAFDVTCAPATQLAFARSGGGDGGIYTIKSNGTAEARLTGTLDWSPAWSRDGSKIAFQSSRDGHWQIYAMDANGANVARLTNTVAQDADPAWSPDGSKIAFWSDRDGNREIYVMGANGSNPVRLTNQAGDDTHPTWSPDGSKIAFVSSRDGNAEIYLMNADGQNPVRVTINSVEDIEPDWSPDGTKLAVSRSAGCEDYSGFCFYDLWIMNVDGSNPMQITGGTGGSADFSPSWSGDGLWIAYQSDVCQNYGYYYYQCYYSYSVVRLVRVDGSRGIDLAYNAFQPAWRR